MSKKDLKEVNSGSLATNELHDLYEQDYKENLSHISDAFYKISIQGGRFKVEGKPIGEQGISFTGIILNEIPVNMWYKERYNPAKPTPPNCWSVGGLKPQPECSEKQSESCVFCKKNKWGTGTDREGRPSRGKACANSRRLILKIRGVQFPCILSLPPTSTKSFNQYLKALCIGETKYPMFAVLTEFSFDTNKQYPQILVFVKEVLSKEEYLEMRGYRGSEEIKNVVNAYVQPDSEEMDDEREDEI